MRVLFITMNEGFKVLWIEAFLRLFSIPFSLKMKTSIISKIGIIFSMRLFSFMQHGTCYSRCQLKYLNFAIASKDGKILLYSHCNEFCIRQRSTKIKKRNEWYNTIYLRPSTLCLHIFFFNKRLKWQCAYLNMSQNSFFVYDIRYLSAAVKTYISCQFKKFLFLSK